MNDIYNSFEPQYNWKKHDWCSKNEDELLLFFCYDKLG